MRRSGGLSRTRVPAVDGVSLDVGRAETYGLVGESGSGKTTLARMIINLETVDEGEIALILAGATLRPGAPNYWRGVQMVFQDPHSSLDPRFTVDELVAEALTRGEDDRDGRRSRVKETLQQVGLSHEFLSRRPRELSGGELQRVALARALILRPPLLICDEPTSALDVSAQAQILNLMMELQQAAGLSYFFISHNLGVIRYLSHRVGVLYYGKLVEESPAEEIFARPLHPYTVTLLNAVPDTRVVGRRRRLSGGELPTLTARPSGCPFHPRCPVAADRCREEEPPLVEASRGRRIACHFPGAAEYATNLADPVKPGEHP